jgi:O-methyltransferase involved in polyketide biosynthesis
MPEIDTSQPNIARVYDYLLGGKENFAADRLLAEQLLGVIPGMGQWARDNRAFVCAAAARAAREGGITQFLDLGAGLPTRPAVHEAVREVHPDARVAYVDIDPVAVRHAQALLAGRGLTAFQGDLTEPEKIFADPELAGVLDLSQPAGVIIGGVAHFLPAAVMRAAASAYASRLASGSWLMISCGHTEEEKVGENLRPAYTAAQTYTHPADVFTTFFDGTEIVPPGVVEARRWVSGIDAAPPARGLYVQCAAGVKP